MYLNLSRLTLHPAKKCARPAGKVLIGSALALSLTLALGMVPAHADAALPQGQDQPVTIDVPDALPELAPAGPSEPEVAGLSALAAPSALSAEAPESATMAPPAGSPAFTIRDVHSGPGAYMGLGAATALGIGGVQAAARGATALSAPSPNGTPPGVHGLDVSGWQADAATYSKSQVDWKKQWDLGARFMYAKGSEGNNFVDASRLSHLAGAKNQGMLHGAYHFALPSQSSAVSQADFFVNNGGAWTADGSTLPPLLDIENNPYTDPSRSNYQGNTCYSMSPSALVEWVRDFSNRVLATTGRLPMIYTNYYWWKDCMADSSEFVKQDLHIAAYGATSPWMPGGWDNYSFWQYSDNGPLAGDSNVWNGTLAELREFATKAPYQPQSSGHLVQRLSGEDRFATSAAVSRENFAAGVPVVYIANGQSFPDALSGAAAAGTVHAPVLLTNSTGLPTPIKAELSRLMPQQIIILGGTGALSAKVEADLRAFSTTVTRISGADRYATSAAISQATHNPGVSVAYVASGEAFPDALAGAAAAGASHAPILLATKHGVTDTVKAELSRLKPKKITVVGGDGVLTPAVSRVLEQYSASVTVIAGADRYATSAALSAATFKPGTATAFVASGQNFPDALSGAAAAGTAHSPLLLTYSGALPAPVQSELKRLTPRRVVIVGGAGVVSDQVLEAVK